MENAMRWKLACLGMMLACSSLPAAGRPARDKSATASFDPIEAQNYADAVSNAINAIADNYVREVPRTDLTLTALTSLYEAARESVPRTLAADVKQAAAEADRKELLARARQRLGTREGLKGTDAALVSILAMLRTLDPYCAITSDAEIARARAEGPDPGLGLELADNQGVGALLIKSVAPGSPAQRAGLRPRDRITHLNGRPTEEIPAAQVQALLGVRPIGLGRRRRTAEPEGYMRLTVRRPGSRRDRQVTVERLPFHVETVFGVRRQSDNSWDYWLDARRKIAQVRLGSLETGTAAALGEVLKELYGQGLRGLVLDLRWCPGGFLNEASSTAGLFLKEGALVATIKYRKEGTPPEHSAHGSEHFTDFPVVVLVNGETSGGAELIAAALQDHHRAAIVGQRTRGKGSVQSMDTTLTIGVSLKLTTGTFVRPSGKNLHRFPDSKPTDDWGVLPEPRYDCRISSDLGEHLKEWWLLQTLRPGSSNEALPLDDPTADAQRQAALRALLEQIESKGKSSVPPARVSRGS
jgi:C-terminal peptidase prc